MTGAVLCGGLSTRMGTDKGLLPLYASTWAQTAVEKLEALGIPVVLSINEKQRPGYLSLFPDRELVSDQEALAGKGPLGGLLSLHLAHPAEDLFILACDLPLMETRLLRELQSAFDMQSASHAYVYMNGQEFEPLCGIYKAGALAAICERFRNNDLARNSMKFVLGQLDVFSIPVKEPDQKAFRNFNAHAELNGL